MSCLEWQLKYGADTDRYTKLAQAGKASPLHSRPILKDTLSEVWNIFWVLHRQRSAGAMALNPIAFSDILSIFRIYGINGSLLRQKYAAMIEALDGTVLQWIATKHANTKASSR